MAATTPEAKVKKKIDAVLKPYVQRGVMAYNKTAGSMFGSNGWPDYIGTLHGLFWAIEAKAGTKKKPSDLQAARIKDIRTAGGFAVVVNMANVDRLDAFFQKLEARALRIKALLNASS